MDEEEGALIVVRSDKAFSGFEGVVSSQVGKGDKWEAFYVQSNGYGRKRLRVGGVFETAEEAAKAYSAECRKMLRQEMEESSAVDADGVEGGANGGANGGECAACRGAHKRHLRPCLPGACAEAATSRLVGRRRRWRRRRGARGG